MMTTKKEFVKQYVLKMKDRTVTVNSVLRALTGVWSGVRWHDEILDVSRSTIRRALEELEQDGAVKSYYAVGHCFDELLYRKSLSH